MDPTAARIWGYHGRLYQPRRANQATQKSPVLVIIEQHVLARTCILNILKRELTGFEIVEMATTS